MKIGLHSGDISEEPERFSNALHKMKRILMGQTYGLSMSFAFEGPLVTSPIFCHDLPLSVLWRSRSQQISFATECQAVTQLKEIMRSFLLPGLILQVAPRRKETARKMYLPRDNFKNVVAIIEGSVGANDAASRQG